MNIVFEVKCACYRILLHPTDGPQSVSKHRLATYTYTTQEVRTLLPSTFVDCMPEKIGTVAH